MPQAPKKPPQPPSQASGSRPRAFWAPLVVLVLGLASTGLLVWTQRIAEGHVRQDFPLEKASTQLRLDVATAHLWLEEHLTGDPYVQLSRIWDSLDSASHLLQAMLRGGMVDEQHSIREPLDDPVLRRQVEELDELMQGFRDLSLERLAGGGETAGVGSDIDQSYDDAFHVILDKSEVLSAGISERIARNQARSTLIFRVILGAWVLLVGLTVTELWNREKRRQAAEEALHQSEERLRHSQKMEAVGRLAGGMAHDVNNYLAAITSSCELVKLKNRGHGELVERMDTVLGTTGRAASLIRRLLAFSRQQPATLEPVDLNSVVENLAPMMRRLIGEDVRIELRPGTALWSVEADPSELEQVLVNLLVNAREAMPEGGELDLETANLALTDAEAHALGLKRGGEYVRLTVSDTGVGIPPEIRDKIFEPFFTTKGLAESSGLGLATVFGIVRQGGGTIHLDSTPGKGTAFHVYMPRSTGDGRRPRRRGHERVDQSAQLEGSGRVLLVEDNPDVREATTAMLEEMGYTVRVACSGEEAVQVYAEDGDAVDLVITDMVMPGISGRQLAERLREKNPELAILFISGYTDRAVEPEDGVGFLSKPFTAAALAAKIREARG